MMEKMLGWMFRRAERSWSDRLIENEGRLTEVVSFYAMLRRLLVEGRWKPEGPSNFIDRGIGWSTIGRSFHAT